MLGCRGSPRNLLAMAADHHLLEAAARLGAEFAERSEEFEAARRLPADVSDKMAEAGFYRMGVPAVVGGLETPAPISTEAIETLARGDAACAWVAFIGMTSGTALSAVPEATAREIFPDPRTLITGVAAPTGQADRVDGGFTLSGRWQWGSGSRHSDWILAGCVLKENGETMVDRRGAPRVTMAFMPASDVTTLDTWHVSGLGGTGSGHFEVDGVFVPDDRLVGYVKEGRPPITTLFAFPNRTFLALGIGAVCLGIARAAIDNLVVLATSKKPTGSSRILADQQIAKIALAQAEADLRSARALFYATLDEAWQIALSTGKISLEQRRDLRLATTNAVMKSVGVVGQMYDLGGGTSVYRTSALQRHFRDINVAKSHIMVSPGSLEMVGGSLFGLDVDHAFF